MWFVEGDVAFVGPWSAILDSPPDECSLWMPLPVERATEVRGRRDASPASLCSRESQVCREP